MPVDQTETMAETADRILREAKNSGNFAVIQLDNVSYYPIERVKRMIGFNVYGVDVLEEGLISSPKYREMEKESRGTLWLDKPLSHADVEGEFWFFKQEGVYWGILNLRRVTKDRFPEVNLSLVSPLALFPYRHQIRKVSYGNPGSVPRIYTVDEEGSTWSLHGKWDQTVSR